MKSSAITRGFLRQHRAILECLDAGLLNYSSVARIICEKEPEAKFQAVLIALQRTKERNASKSSTVKADAAAVVRKARMRLRTGMVVVQIEPLKDFEKLIAVQRKVKAAGGEFQVIEGDEAITIITNEQHLGFVKASLSSRLLKATKDLSQLSLLFDARIKSTPGVVAMVYSLLAEADINVCEEMSCWTELQLVLDSKDALRAIAALEEFQRN